ncbi:MAG TPA: hypothetical protein VGE31_02455 [Candidatus Paceibacterota bacterium]
MNILFWGLTIGTIGKVLLAVGVIVAHSGLMKERKIDNVVIQSYHREHIITIIGIILIIIGYAMEIYFYGFTPFLTCHGEECSAAVLNAFNQNL